MGKVEDVAVDAWFTGFAETAEGKRYFCVYLGRTDGREVSSTLAREIAIRILRLLLCLNGGIIVHLFVSHNFLRKRRCDNISQFRA